MKRKNNQQPLNEVIDEFLASYRLEGKLNEVKLISSWETIMGKTIARHTKEIYVKNKILYISLDSAALRQELAYAKDKIMALLNTEAKQLLIENVVFK